MARRGWALTFVLSACVDSSSVVCSDGRLCPSGTRCASTSIDPALCVEPAQLEQCAGQPQFTACAALADGRCYDGVCLRGGCGNGYVDEYEDATQDEACDDRNTVSNDGCSADCRSTETCGNGVVDLGQGEQCDDGDTIAHDGCSSVCANETLAWTIFDSDPPEARESAAIAYDAGRARVVIFGGDDYTFSARNHTWEWDGQSWVDVRTPVAPPARSGAGMVYSPAHKGTILYGGSGEVGIFDDTWLWDGSTWSQLQPPVRPEARAYHRLVYDATHARVIMFGGQGSIDDPTPLDDTWALEGSTWTKLPVTGPSPRVNCGMAYDPTRATTVLVGGYVQYTGTEPMIDTWELDDQGWHLRDTNGPFVQSETNIAFDPTTGKLVMFGDHNGDVTTWTWTGSSWVSLTTAANPTPRTGHALVTDSGHQRVLLFGGVDLPITSTATARGDTWELAGTVWAEKPSKQWPSKRNSSALASDVKQGHAIAFGGFDSSGTPLADTWRTDQRDWSLLLPLSSPEARAEHAMAYDAARDRVVMFGGVSTQPQVQVRGDTWLWDGTNWLDTGATSPGGRRHAAMAYDAAHAEIVMFGGEVGTANNPLETNGFLGDTQVWNGTAWTRRDVTPSPDERYGAAMAYDPIRHRLVLFGGEGYGGDREDTWEWDGTTWTRRAMFGPLKRHRAAMAWDPTRRKMIIYGGQTQTIMLDDAWEWDAEAGRWDLLSVEALAGRTEHSMISGANGGVFVFGGRLANGGPLTSDNATLRWDNKIPDENCLSTGIDADDDGALGCADTDCWATCTPSCPPQTSCDPAQPHCGDGSCSALETCQSCPADCTCAPTCGDYRCDPSEALSCPGDC